MRPVDKGNAPKTYTDHGQARHDLAVRIGYYCSYCEMKIRNSIEVEHILPQNQGGAPLDWDNFLLSCKYCNTRKGDHNDNLDDYLWPDRDNTDLAYTYSEAEAIVPKSNLDAQLRDKAQESIDLMKLNLHSDQTTEADTRWRSRKEAWDLAQKSYTNWKAAPILAMANQIAKTSLNGHYSIWIEVFKNEPMVLTEIDKEYRKIGLFKQLDEQENRIIRAGARI
ncbi:MAG: HNH endonuclease [Marinifilaceae bacterium]|jgi:uncharacterized protein (TIGR02646 family)|nr:HNH endonuclease [Marinifilaceae bacterium]